MTRPSRSSPPCADPGLRPPLVRLLGGRRARVEGRSSRLARRPPRWILSSPRRRGPGTRSSTIWAPGRHRRTRSRGQARRVGEPVPRRRRRDRSRTRSRRRRRPALPSRPTRPRKLRLLGRGLGIAGSYAKVLVDGDRTLRVLPVRAAHRVPAGATDPGPLSAPSGGATASGHHLHLHDRRRLAARATACDWSRPSAKTWRRAGSRRWRRTRSSARRLKPPAARRPRSGKRPGSSAPSTTHASRSCVASWREVTRGPASAAWCSWRSPSPWSSDRGQTSVTPSQPPVSPTASIASSLPSSAVAPSPLILVDEDLLALLPASVDGIALVSDPETAASIASDPDPRGVCSGHRRCVRDRPGASVADDLAVVSVVQLRPDVFDDAFFRAWRDTYDAAACAAAGGVAGNAEAEFDGHETYIGSCVQGAFTYHVYLGGSGRPRLHHVGRRAPPGRAGRGRSRRVGFGHG